MYLFCTGYFSRIDYFGVPTSIKASTCNCQARVLVHFQSQSQMSNMKTKQRTSADAKIQMHHHHHLPHNVSTSIERSKVHLQCLNSKRTFKYPLPPFTKPYQTKPYQRGWYKRSWEEIRDEIQESQGPSVPRSNQGSNGPIYLKVTFKYELDSKEGPSCFRYLLNKRKTLKSHDKLWLIGAQIQMQKRSCQNILFSSVNISG